MSVESLQLTPAENAAVLCVELEDAPPKTILAAVDMHDDRVLLTAIPIAQHFHANLILLHVVDDLTVAAYSNPYTGWPLITDYLRDEARKLLTKCIALVPIGIDAHTMYREGNPAAEIACAAADVHADLVILGKHHHSLLHRLLTQSTCNAACHRIACPVIVLQDDAPPTLFHHSSAAVVEDGTRTPQPQ